MSFTAKQIIDAISFGSDCLIPGVGRIVDGIMEWSAHCDLDDLKNALREKGKNWSREDKLKANTAYMKVEPELHRSGSPLPFDV